MWGRKKFWLLCETNQKLLWTGMFSYCIFVQTQRTGKYACVCVRVHVSYDICSDTSSSKRLFAFFIISSPPYMCNRSTCFLVVYMRCWKKIMYAKCTIYCSGTKKSAAGETFNARRRTEGLEQNLKKHFKRNFLYWLPFIYISRIWMNECKTVQIKNTV